MSTNKPSAVPTRKVAVGGFLNAIIGILAWYLADYQDVVIPGAVQGMLHTVAVFAAQYLIPDA